MKLSVTLTRNDRTMGRGIEKPAHMGYGGCQKEKRDSKITQGLGYVVFLYTKWKVEEASAPTWRGRRLSAKDYLFREKIKNDQYGGPIKTHGVAPREGSTQSSRIADVNLGIESGLPDKWAKIKVRS